MLVSLRVRRVDAAKERKRKKDAFVLDRRRARREKLMQSMPLAILIICVVVGVNVGCATVVIKVCEGPYCSAEQDEQGGRCRGGDALDDLASSASPAFPHPRLRHMRAQGGRVSARQARHWESAVSGR